MQQLAATTLRMQGRHFCRGMPSLFPDFYMFLKIRSALTLGGVLDGLGMEPPTLNALGYRSWLKRGQVQGRA